MTEAITVKTSIPGRVLFACTHNSIRSPMAEALMRWLYPDAGFVDSCGITVRDEIGDGFTIAVMGELGLDVTSHEPRSFNPAEDKQADLIVCFSEASFERARSFVSGESGLVEYWPVYDPDLVAEGREARLGAYRRVRDRIRLLLEERFGSPRQESA